MKKLLIAMMVTLSAFGFDAYPSKPLTIIVGFGEGGSADRMTRVMVPFLKETFGVDVRVQNIEGEGTKKAAEYVLNQPHDGYTLFASTFSPYMPNTIIAGNASYKVQDFEFINLQWFDYDFIALHQDSPIKTLLEFLDAIKNNSLPHTVAVMRHSNAHVILTLLLDMFHIDQTKVRYMFFESGKSARESLAHKKVDALIISAQGSEFYRKEIKPLVLIKEKRVSTWDAPTLHEVLAQHNMPFPAFKGSIRGFAVSKKFMRDYPERYAVLVQAFKNVLAQKKVQRELKRNKIGYSWIGPEKSNDLLQNVVDTFISYEYLFQPRKQ